MKVLLILVAITVAVLASHTPQSDITPLKLFEGSYSATGIVQFRVPLPFPEVGFLFPTVPARLDVDETSANAFWDQTFFQLWAQPNQSYITLPLPEGPLSNLCLFVPFGFHELNEAYHSATSFDKAEKPKKEYIGMVRDVALCCDTVGVFINKFGNMLTRVRHAQRGPAFAGLINDTRTDRGTITADNIFNHFGSVDSSNFDLPPQCLNASTIFDYCATTYEPFGWCIEESGCAIPYNTVIPGV